MSGIDIFGLKDGEHKQDREETSFDSPQAQPPRRYGLWRALDALFLLACLGLMTERVLFHLGSAKTVAVRPTAPRPKPPEPKKEEPKPEPPAPKEEAKAPEAPRPSLIAPAKGPIGSPSVNAPDLPQRSASAFEAPAPAKKAPAPAKKAPEPSAARSAVKPVEFTHVIPDAKEVYLLGPFLVRTGGRKAMTKVAASTWQTTVYLNSGAVYHYRFETVSTAGRRSTTGRRSTEVR